VKKERIVGKALRPCLPDRQGQNGVSGTCEDDCRRDFLPADLPASRGLVAAHVAGSKLPYYASAFALDRYKEPGYQKLFGTWGESGQL